MYSISGGEKCVVIDQSKAPSSAQADGETVFSGHEKLRFSTLTKFLVNQKRVSVCKYTIKITPHDSFK
jgi:hypothetical protein